MFCLKMQKSLYEWNSTALVIIINELKCLSPSFIKWLQTAVCSYSCIQIILTLWTWIIYVSVIHHYYVFRSERTTFFWFLTSKHLSVFDECLTILCNYYKPWNTIWLSRFPRGRLLAEPYGIGGGVIVVATCIFVWITNIHTYISVILLTWSWISFSH